MPSILIINPNSSVSITQNLKDILEPAPDFTYKFFTGPQNGPAEIDSYSTAVASTSACLPLLLPILDQHDAFLVACFSDHPLVHVLREYTQKPVQGIFQASVLHALAIGRGKFATVTTARVWERLLDDAVHSFLGSTVHYAGTFSTGLGVLELHEADEEAVNEQIGRAALNAVNHGATVILLGCAGMSGMEQSILSAVGNNVRVIDPVVAGTEILVGMVRSNY